MCLARGSGLGVVGEWRGGFDFGVRRKKKGKGEMEEEENNEENQ